VCSVCVGGGGQSKGEKEGGAIRFMRSRREGGRAGGGAEQGRESGWGEGNTFHEVEAF
jgi:hypothetical protein